MEEVNEYVLGIEAGDEGEHVWDNYQRVASILMRLQQLHNDLAYDEVMGTKDEKLKKFRTLILDPTIDRFDKLAAFESRKITGKAMEIQRDR